MSAGRARRRLVRRAAAAIAAVTAALSGVASDMGRTAAAIAAAPSSVSSPSSSTSGARFNITLDELAPKVVRPGDTVTLAGTMVNTSGEPLTAVTLTLRISTQRITTRYELAHDAEPGTQFGVLLTSTRQPVGDDGRVEAGQRVDWQVKLPMERVAMPTSAAQFGAFPIAVEVTSRGDSGIVRTRLPTTIIWMPGGAQYTPTKISWLWPLIDGIHRGLGDTFADDALATDLGAEGRLGRLVRVGAQSHLPLTYVIDPALVDDASAMAAGAAAGSAGGAGPPSGSPPSTPASSKPTAKAGATGSAAPYRVAAGDQTEPGTGATEAREWLATVGAAIAGPGSATVATPYGDADVVALEHAGLEQEIAIARSTGQSMIRSELAAPTLPDLLWPVGGQLDVATLDDLATDLVATVVLNGRTLEPQDPNAIAGPRADLQTPSGTVRAVLSDPTIDDLVANPRSVPGGVRAAEQRFLAETMLVTEQRPGSGSALVIAPPRHLDAGAYVTALLSDSASVPWLRAVNVGEVAAMPAGDVARRQLAYPASARDLELPAHVLAPVNGLRDGLAAFNSILGPTTSDPFISDANEALLRAESSSWRTHPARAGAIIDDVRAKLQTHLNKVFISKPGLITLTSRKQKIPLTVVNELPEPVTVQVSLRAVNAARLKVTPVQPFTIEGKGSRHEVVVEVEATTGGRFEVQAQLTTADDRVIGQPVNFELNSTAYGAVALAIAGGAAGLLFLLSAVRIYRRVRRRRGGPPETDAGAPRDAPAAPPAQPVP